jgi:hypothetical protein
LNTIGVLMKNEEANRVDAALADIKAMVSAIANGQLGITARLDRMEEQARRQPQARVVEGRLGRVAGEGVLQRRRLSPVQLQELDELVEEAWQRLEAT